MRLGGERGEPLRPGRQLSGLLLDPFSLVLADLEQPDLARRAETDALQLRRRRTLARPCRRLLRLQLERADPRQLGGQAGGAVGVRVCSFVQRPAEPRRDCHGGEQRLVQPIAPTCDATKQCGVHCARGAEVRDLRERGLGRLRPCGSRLRLSGGRASLILKRVDLQRELAPTRLQLEEHRLGGFAGEPEPPR